MSENFNTEAGQQHILSDKAELRHRFLTLRKASTVEQRQAADLSICQHIADLLERLRHGLGEGNRNAIVPSNLPCVGMYQAFRGEADIARMAGDLRAHDWRTAFPVTHRQTHTLSFHEVGDGTQWSEGAYGIREPVIREDASCEDTECVKCECVKCECVKCEDVGRPHAPHATGVPLQDLHVLLVPGVAFTRDGYRLGYGGGYYDRVFARADVRAHRVGIAYACQVAEQLPQEAHDVRMDYLVTEEEVLVCPSSR